MNRRRFFSRFGRAAALVSASAAPLPVLAQIPAPATVHVPTVAFEDGGTALSTNRLEVMERLSEKGVPFPFRQWCAAGGYNLDQLVRELEKQDGRQSID